MMNCASDWLSGGISSAMLGTFFPHVISTKLSYYAQHVRLLRIPCLVQLCMKLAGVEWI